MLYSPGLMGKSMREVIAILKVTEPTLRMWILVGKIKPEITEIRGRKYYDFPEEEVERVRKLINKRWRQGKAKLG